MCGIVGYVGCKNATPILIEALKKLEYRGYDSSGIAVFSGEDILVEKAKGALKFLEKKVSALVARGKLNGALGIGHTRWATHGEPNDKNAHPQTNVSGTIAVVHNGIIENYLELKCHLQARGVVFKSDTDTEVVAHLVNFYYETEHNIFEAVRKAVARLSGSYALGVLCKDFPDRIIAARKESPLIVGLGNGENFIASDVPAVLSHTRSVHFLLQNEMAVLYEDHVDLFSAEGEKVLREPFFVDWDADSAEKGGFEHFMLKEIYEQPKALTDTIRPRIVFEEKSYGGEQKIVAEKILAKGVVAEKVSMQEVASGEIASDEIPTAEIASDEFSNGEISTGKIASGEILTSEKVNDFCESFEDEKNFKFKKCENGEKCEKKLKKAIDIKFDEIDFEKDWACAKKIVIASCGTAYHAAVVAKYAFEDFARIPTIVDVASEFRYRNPVFEENSIFIVISQSGETADTLAAMRLAKNAGAKVIAITNCVGSTISREADKVIYTWAGPEIAVASTKAYTTQLACLYLLALKAAKVRSTINDEDFFSALEELLELPKKVEEILAQKQKIQKFAAMHFNKEKIFYIGRLFDSASALESALKLKEVSYMHSEAFPAGELKHGPIALVDKSTLVVAIATQKSLYEKIASNILEVKTRGAATLVITQANEKVFSDCADTIIKIPKTLDSLSAILAIIPAQLFAYYCAIQHGTDPDKPRNLAKSVTVE